MLKQSVAYMLNYYTYDKPSERLKKLANLHGKKALNIQPYLYDVWLESLIQAVSICDPRFSQKVEQSWRVVM